jgi:hypothetical protein
MGAQVNLFVDILNKALFFFDAACPTITVKFIQGLVSNANNNLRFLCFLLRHLLTSAHAFHFFFALYRTRLKKSSRWLTSMRRTSVRHVPVNEVSQQALLHYNNKHFLRLIHHVPPFLTLFHFDFVVNSSRWLTSMCRTSTIPRRRNRRFGTTTTR